MEYEDEDQLCVSMEEFSLSYENASSIGRMSRKSNNDEYKSNSFETERRRRERLSSMLLMLRSLVPNMNKASIIEDTITYIKKLHDEVHNLSQELLRETDAVEDTNNWGIRVIYKEKDGEYPEVHQTSHLSQDIISKM